MEIELHFPETHVSSSKLLFGNINLPCHNQTHTIMMNMYIYILFKLYIYMYVMRIYIYIINYLHHGGVSINNWKWYIMAHQDSLTIADHAELPLCCTSHTTTIYPTNRYIECTLKYPTLKIWVFPKMWYPQIIHFHRVFHYKPSILGFSSYFGGNTHIHISLGVQNRCLANPTASPAESPFLP